MKAKEKAQELIHNFENVDLLKDFGGMDIELAIQCAKIAVEEIMIDHRQIGTPQGNKEYWQEVKQELEKM